MSKLVRDLIPEHAEKNGKPGNFCTLSDTEYRYALYAKLNEESAEVGDASRLPLNDPRTRRERITEELADLLEVIDAVMTHEAISDEDLFAAKDLKLKLKGGFTKRICLKEDAE